MPYCPGAVLLGSELGARRPLTGATLHADLAVIAVWFGLRFRICSACQIACSDQAPITLCCVEADRSTQRRTEAVLALLLPAATILDAPPSSQPAGPCLQRRFHRGSQGTVRLCVAAASAEFDAPRRADETCAWRCRSPASGIWRRSASRLHFDRSAAWREQSRRRCAREAPLLASVWISPPIRKMAPRPLASRARRRLCLGSPVRGGRDRASQQRGLGTRSVCILTGLSPEELYDRRPWRCFRHTYPPAHRYLTFL